MVINDEFLGTVFECDLRKEHNITKIAGLHQPRHVFHQTDDDEAIIIVTEAEGCCVKLYDTEFQLLKKFRLKGSMDGELGYPSCSLLYQGHLFVADPQNKRISEYTYKGKFVKHLLNFFQHPQFISIQNNILMVFLNEDVHRSLGGVVCYEIPD